VACSEEEAAEIVGDETNREKEEKIGLRRNSPFLKVGSGPRFSDWAPEYLAWYETAFPRSFRKIVDHFKPLLLHFGHLKIADGQEEGWSEAWASYESDRAVSGSTLASELSTLTTALNRASATGGRKKKTKRWKLVRVSPVAELAFSHDDGEEERHHFSADELEAIYQADPKNAADWKFLAFTGLRRGEAFTQLGKLVTNQQVRVSHSPKAGIFTKNKKGRVIPLSPDAQEARERIIFDNNEDHRFFRTRHPSTWSHEFADALRKADVAEGSLHSLRHTFITMAANNPAIAIANVKKWAGHAHLKTTQLYIHDVACEEARQVGSLGAI